MNTAGTSERRRFTDLTKTKGTIGDLVSTNPQTGERNLFICLDMGSPTMKSICPGVLKQSLAESVLKSKSYVYTLIPPANDLNFENIGVTETMDPDIQSTFH